ncbi:hypothetical protein LWI29_032473 [Acer saccharum]|uniref:Retrotransposon gag domain-containing protein n=1 Tax=Acer saccharum TaxID=4024 RepID=A0AA39RN18_ACESA|nr:hypothetical protein LWI29_032473 [Acer saccharum]
MVDTKFNWCWYHVPTFAPYKVEGMFFPLILAHDDSAQSAKTTAIVLQSLTPNAQSVFKILAEYQLSHPNEEGMLIDNLYIFSRERFLQRLHLYENHDHDENEEFEDDGVDVNPFHQTRNHVSDDSTPLHPRDLRHYILRDREKHCAFNAKVEILEFEGKMQPDELVEWLNAVDRIFDYQDVPENKKVKLVAIKLRKHASFWWENLKRQRERDGRSRIFTWEKMKKELKRKYLPDNYRQDIFLKINNFRQRDLSMAEYTTEFDNLMLKGDVGKPEEQSMVRYLGGLNYEISNVVQLQPYWSLNDVCKLVLKVEKQQKEMQSKVLSMVQGKALLIKEALQVLSLLQQPKPIQKFQHQKEKIVSLVEEDSDEDDLAIDLKEGEYENEKVTKDVTYGDKGASLFVKGV